MTISSSLNAGVAGLSANASRLGTISDNIANSSTAGYKRVETDFQSMVISEGGSQYVAGGVRTTNQRLIDEAGALVSTNNSTDLAVRGKGFLPVTLATQVTAGADNPSMYLASTGSFRTDAEGYLRTESGLMLLGWPANPDGTVPSVPRDTSTALEPVRIDLNQFRADPTTTVDLGINLSSLDTVTGSIGSPSAVQVEYFDEFGTSQSLDITFTPADDGLGQSNEWQMIIRDSATPDDAGTAFNPADLTTDESIVGVYTVTFQDAAGANPGSLDTVVLADVDGGGTTIGTAYAGATGMVQVDTADGSGSLDIFLGFPGTMDGLQQLAAPFAPTNITKDGSPVGTMTSVQVDENGFVQAFFDTGVIRTIYQVPLVDVANPNGLSARDGQIYSVTPESGAFYLWDASDGPTGSIVSFAREESATDVASELTDMIQTQRAYSTNAKVIQTVDEMLQETTNIKR